MFQSAIDAFNESINSSCSVKLT